MSWDVRDMDKDEHSEWADDENHFVKCPNPRCVEGRDYHGFVKVDLHGVRPQEPCGDCEGLETPDPTCEGCFGTGIVPSTCRDCPDPLLVGEVWHSTEHGYSCAKCVSEECGECHGEGYIMIEPDTECAECGKPILYYESCAINKYEAVCPGGCEEDWEYNQAEQQRRYRLGFED